MSYAERYTGDEELSLNTVRGSFKSIKDSEIVFYGEGNAVFVEPGVRLQGCSLAFAGDNAALYLSTSRYPYRLSASIGGSSSIYLGDDFYANTVEAFRLKTGEGKQILVGDNEMFSLGVTLDATAGDISIGNYCWLGECATVSGPCHIGGGCVVGAASRVCGIDVESFHTVVGSNRVLDGKSIHANDSIKNHGRRGKTRIIKPYADQIKRNSLLAGIPYKDIRDKTAYERTALIADWKRGKPTERKLRVLGYVNQGALIYARRFTAKLAHGNRVIGSPVFNDSSLRFHGSNNTLICEPGTAFKGSHITFLGDNGVAFFGKADGYYCLSIDVSRDSTAAIGAGCHIAGHLSITASEGRNVLIGRDCSFGDSCWIRSSDQHGVYDYDRLTRLNYPKSTVIEDGCSIGDNCHVLKGAHIRSGVNVPSHSVFTNGTYDGVAAKKFDAYERSLGRVASVEERLEAAARAKDRCDIIASLG